MTQSYQTGNTAVILVIIIAIAAVGIVLYSTQSNSDAPVEITPETTTDAAPQMEEEMMGEENMDDMTADSAEVPSESSEAAANTDVSSPETVEEAVVDAAPSASPTLAGTFTDYDPTLLTADTNVLFFHASWCPSCRGLENNITDNIDDIPSDVTILKLDYDTETELRQQYGVVRQHTLVVVDENGTEVKKLTGLTNTLEQVLGQL